MEQLRSASAVFEQVWGRGPEGVPIHSEILRELVHAGGCISGAFDGDDLVGAAVLGVARPAGATYGYLAAARPGRAGSGVGRALKLHQRAWGLERGLTSMRWTFDPLVARNARFNLGRLGATAPEYEIAFYGRMTDEVNGDDDADRLVAHWRFDDDRVARLAADTGARGAPIAHGTNGTRGVEGEAHPIDSRGSGRGDPRDLVDPVPDPDAEALADGPDGAVMLRRDRAGLWLRVPTDIVALRRSDPAQASAWRAATREVFAPTLAAGGAAVHVTRDGWYLLTEPAPARAAGARVGAARGSHRSHDEGSP